MSNNLSTASKLPMSQVQRRKLMELDRGILGGTDAEASVRLDALFRETFKHDMSEATYEEGARITANLLARQREAKTPAARPLNVCPECGQVAPNHTPPCTIGFPKAEPKETETQAETPKTMPQLLTESPYSWNTFVEAQDGFGEQFTIRAGSSDEFIKKIEGLKHYLTGKGYKPQTRGPRTNTTVAPAEGENVPNCVIHNKPMVKRSKDGRSWWSCSEKLADGQWCQYRPKQ